MLKPNFSPICLIRILFLRYIYDVEEKSFFFPLQELYQIISPTTLTKVQLLEGVSFKGYAF